MRWRLTVGMGLTVVGLLVGGLSGWLGGAAPETVDDASVRPARATALGATAAQVDQTAGASPSAPEPGLASPVGAVRGDADPVDELSAPERVALEQALAQHPQKAVELRRIAAFLRLQRQVEAWREARLNGADAATLRALAAPVEAALHAALQAHSLRAGEALQLQAALIADREPDAARRQQALAAWRAEHLTEAPAGVNASERRFLAEQQALVAAHQRLPREQQQPQALALQLEALRQQHFAEPVSSQQ